MAQGTFKLSASKPCTVITNLSPTSGTSGSATSFTFDAQVTSYQSLSSITFYGGDGQSAAVTLDGSPTGTAPSPVTYSGNAASITYVSAGDYYPYLVLSYGNGQTETIYMDIKVTQS